MIGIASFLWLQLDKQPNHYKQKTTLPNEEEKVEKPQMVHIERSDGSEMELALEVYLQGVVGSEMPASFELEALKAQAVAARTFVCKRQYKVDDTTASQVYHDEEQLKSIWKDDYDVYHKKIVEALDATKGEIMTYQGDCITAAFFSSSNGATNNSEDYWQEALPYLRSVDSSWDKNVEGVIQQVSFTPLAFATALGFQNPIRELKEPIRYVNGYVESITMDGIVFHGREIREKLNLRSSAFDIIVDDTGYTITTSGYGHGIGMSQMGAQEMAKAKKTYREILTHYYTDIEIQELNV